MDRPLRAWTLNGLDKFRIVGLSDVQRRVLDASKTYIDCLVQSRAGTGKTTAVGILISETHEAGAASLVLIPNETLAAQVVSDLTRMFLNSLCTVLSLASIRREENPVRSGVNPLQHVVIVADVNTLIQHPGCLSRLRIQNLLFDEADELFDDALHERSASILKDYLGNAKTMFFSATFPPHIVTRIEEALSFADPNREEVPHHIKLCVSTSVDSSVNAVVPHVRKYYSVVDEDAVSSTVRLVDMYLAKSSKRIVIFGGSINFAQSVAEQLRKGNTKAIVMKSPLDDFSRAQVILDPHGFLSRGVNIPGLDCGIAVGIPIQKETLLHQWGRIAREGQQGHFHHLVTAEEVDQLNFLSFQLGVNFEEYSLPKQTSLHPFEIHASTEERMKHVIHLIERVS